MECRRKHFGRQLAKDGQELHQYEANRLDKLSVTQTCRTLLEVPAEQYAGHNLHAAEEWIPRGGNVEGPVSNSRQGDLPEY